MSTVTTDKPFSYTAERGSDEWREECEHFRAIYAELNAKYFDGNLPPEIWIQRGMPEGAAKELNGLTRTRGLVRRDTMKTDDETDPVFIEYMASHGRSTKYIVLDTKIYLDDFLLKQLPTDELRRTLLHEMVHVAVKRRYGRRSGKHGKRFANECNRIAMAHGWPEVFPHDNNPDACWLDEWEDCQYWPGYDEEVQEIEVDV